MDDSSLGFIDTLDDDAQINQEKDIFERYETKILEKSVRYENTNMIKNLLNDGINIHKKLKGGSTLLHYAAFYGKLEVVKYLCKEGFDLNATNKRKETPLHLACAKSHYDILIFLVNEGADLNAVTNKGWTPIHYAVRNRNTSCIRWLRNHGASIDKKTNKGLEPIHYAIQTKNTGIILYLYGFTKNTLKSDTTVLEQMVRIANVKIFRYLLNRGEKIDAYFKIGLENGIKKGKVDFVKEICLFFDPIDNLNEKDENGVTPLNKVMYRYPSFDIFYPLFTSQLSNENRNFTTFIPFQAFQDTYSFLNANQHKDDYFHEKFIRKQKVSRQIIDFLHYHDWIYRRINEKKSNFTNKLIGDHIHSKFLCKFDINNVHLLSTKQELPCGHQVCLSCMLRLYADNGNIVCFTTDCYTEFKIDLNEVMTDESACPVKYEKDDLMLLCRSVSVVVDKLLSWVHTTKETVNDESYPHYLDVLAYMEDSIDIRIESIKIELEKIEKKTIKHIEKIKTKLKTCSDIHYAEFTYKFLRSRNCMNPVTQLHLKDIGALKVELKLIFREPYMLETIKNIEDMVRKSDEKHVEINEIISKLNDASKFRSKSDNSDMSNRRFLIEAEKLMTNLTEVTKNYSKLESLFQTDRNCRRALEELIKLEEKKNDFRVNEFFSSIQAISESTNSEELLKNINYLQSDRQLTENELKAFSVIRNGTIEQLKQLFVEDKNISLKVHYKSFNLLLEAIYIEKCEFVEYLIQLGSNMAISDEVGRSPLQLAALTNHDVAILNLLVKMGCPFPNDELKAIVTNDEDGLKKIDLNKVDSFGATPLHYIAAIGNVDCLTHLTDLSKADYKIKDNRDFTCIERAASNGRLEMLLKLVDIFKIELNYTNYSLKNIIYVALSFSNSVDVIKWWFENMKLIPQNFVTNNSLVIWTGGKENKVIKEKLDLLISKGGDLTARDSNGYNLIMVYAENVYRSPNSVELIEYLIANGINLEDRLTEGQTLYHLMAKNGLLGMMQLISKHLSLEFLNTYDNKGYTPLMYAIQNGHIDVVKWFLKLEKLTWTCQNEINIIDFAIASGFSEIANAVKQHFNLNATNYFQKTLDTHKIGTYKTYAFHPHELSRISETILPKLGKPIDIVVKWFKTAKLEMLIDQNIPFEKYKDYIDATVLHIAAAFGRHDIILWLYINDFDFYSVDKLGYTALFYAASNGRIETVLLLSALGLNDLYQSGIEPLLNHYRYLQLYQKTFSLDMFLEELYICIETLSYAFSHVSTEKLYFLKGLIDNMPLKRK